MADEIDVSKIDALIMTGASDTTIEATKIDALISIGASEGMLEVSKIDTFVMVGPRIDATIRRVTVGMQVLPK